MTDIVELLRTLKDLSSSANYQEACVVQDQAADEIESLRQQLAESQKSIQIFHDTASKLEQQLDMFITREKVWSKTISSRDEQLAEYQARVSELEVIKCTMAYQQSIPCRGVAEAKREALLEAATAIDNCPYGRPISVFGNMAELVRNIAKELE